MLRQASNPSSHSYTSAVPSPSLQTTTAPGVIPRYAAYPHLGAVGSSPVCIAQYEFIEPETPHDLELRSRGSDVSSDAPSKRSGRMSSIYDEEEEQEQEEEETDDSSQCHHTEIS